MRFFWLASAAGLACLAAGPALAKTVVTTTTTYYTVAADNGIGLIQAMDRKGPRHGFMTRAIAQTSYTVGWHFSLQKKDGSCRLKGAEADLEVTFSYPQVTSPMSDDLSRRWNRFFEGVQKHEETHGRIARAMVSAATKAVKGISFDGDPKCDLVQAEAKQRIATVYAQFEAKQIAFDKREHREGGNVEKLLLGLKGDEQYQRPDY